MPDMSRFKEKGKNMPIQERNLATSLRDRLTAYRPGKIYYVDTSTGNDGESGRNWDTAFVTVAHALSVMGAGDTVYVVGDVREQTATTANYQSIVALSPTVSQRARWRTPASAAATTPLLDVKHRGCVVSGFTFNAPTDTCGVRLFRDATFNSGDSEITDCDFQGGAIGIESKGAPANCKVRRNQFRNITSGSVATSGGIISTGTSTAEPLAWRIEDNTFLNSKNHIVMPGNSLVIEKNTFQDIGHDITADKCMDLSGGTGRNWVANNRLGGAFSATLYVKGTNDEWVGNFTNETAGVEGGDP